MITIDPFYFYCVTLNSVPIVFLNRLVMVVIHKGLDLRHRPIHQVRTTDQGRKVLHVFTKEAFRLLVIGKIGRS